MPNRSRRYCQRKDENPQLSNLELAIVQNIIAQSEKWINIDINEPHAKKLRPKWQTLEEALSLWTSTVIENGYALTGDAILAKSRDYAKRLEINDFRGTTIL